MCSSSEGLAEDCTLGDLSELAVRECCSDDGTDRERFFFFSDEVDENVLLRVIGWQSVVDVSSICCGCMWCLGELTELHSFGWCSFSRDMMFCTFEPKWWLCVADFWKSLAFINLEICKIVQNFKLLFPQRTEYRLCSSGNAVAAGSSKLRCQSNGFFCRFWVLFFLFDSFDSRTGSFASC